MTGDDNGVGVLAALADESVREVLSALDDTPRSAKDLGDTVDLSLPTVYRRLDMLEELNLVVSRTEPASDGNHYKVYECNFDSTVVNLTDGDFDVDVYRRESAAERFAGLWRELSDR